MKTNKIQIRKGDKFLCKENFLMGEALKFRKGETYRSAADCCLTDLMGNSRTGFNQDILDKHFKKLPKYNVMDVLKVILFILVIPFYCIGLIIYFLSKVIRSIAHLLMLQPASAKDQYHRFWSVYTSLGDIL